MSSAFLWILMPVALGIGLLFYRRSDSLPLISGITLTLFLAWVAWQLPIDSVLQLGPVSVEIAPNFILFGRNFTLDNIHRPLLALIYLAESFWILGTFIARPGRLFIPISLITIGLFFAALSVDPFLYAALILGMVVLIFVPLLVPQGSRPGQGILRFLTFQFFAVPFILFTGWMLSGVESSPGNLGLVLRSGILLALGFMFLLALFPFHSWLPMLAEESHPYIFGFLVLFLPSITSLFALSFLDRYAWLRDTELAYQLLASAGAVAVCLGGLWAAGQRHLGRLFAFTAMVATGANLQAIGLSGSNGVQTFFALLLPNAWTLWIFAVALAIFWDLGKGQLDLESLRAQFPSHPFLLSIVVLAIFSIAGLPLLASFPAHLAVWVGAAAYSPAAAIVSLVGSLGLGLAGLRLFLTLFANPLPKRANVNFGDEVATSEIEIKDLTNPYRLSFIILSLMGLLGFGLLPRFFLMGVPGLAAMFPQLFP